MNTNNDSLSIPNNILLQHEHALKVLNLTMNMGDSSMNGTNSSALSGNNTIGEQQYQQEEPQSNSHDNSNYIDFSETNKQYGNHFNAKNDVPTPVTAELTGTIKNLIGQSRSIEFREIKETNAVYYVSTFRFDKNEVYRIDLDVTPDGSNRTFDVKFSQKFYQE